MDLNVYEKFFEEKNSLQRSIKIGIKIEYINLLLQQLFTTLAQNISSYEKKKNLSSQKYL